MEAYSNCGRIRVFIYCRLKILVMYFNVPFNETEGLTCLLSNVVNVCSPAEVISYGDP